MSTEAELRTKMAELLESIERVRRTLREIAKTNVNAMRPEQRVEYDIEQTKAYGSLAEYERQYDQLLKQVIELSAQG